MHFLFRVILSSFVRMKLKIQCALKSNWPIGHFYFQVCIVKTSIYIYLRNLLNTYIIALLYCYLLSVLTDFIKCLYTKVIVVLHYQWRVSFCFPFYQKSVLGAAFGLMTKLIWQDFLHFLSDGWTSYWIYLKPTTGRKTIKLQPSTDFFC